MNRATCAKGCGSGKWESAHHTSQKIKPKTTMTTSKWIKNAMLMNLAFGSCDNSRPRRNRKRSIAKRILRRVRRIIGNVFSGVRIIERSRFVLVQKMFPAMRDTEIAAIWIGHRAFTELAGSRVVIGYLASFVGVLGRFLHMEA